MTIFRAFISVLAAALMLVCNAPADGAADIGDWGAIDAIRHDIPILLAARLPRRHIPTVDWVVTDGSRAIAAWTEGSIGGLFALTLRQGKWRMVAEASRDKDGWWSGMGDAPICSHNYQDEPSAQGLVNANLIEARFLKDLTFRLEPMAPKTPRLQEVVDCYYTYAFQYIDEYFVTFTPLYDTDSRTEFGIGTTATGAGLVSRGGMLGLNLSAQEWSGRPSQASAAVKKSELTIWAPFVLDPQRKYVLTLDWAPAPIQATLRNNVLIFEVPAFTIVNGSVTRGIVQVE